MELIEIMKYIIENTNLYIEIDGQDPKIASDFGRAISINLETQIVKFDRRESTKRQLSAGMAWGQNIFLRTHIPFKDTSFEIIRNWSIEDSSWKKWKMDEFTGDNYYELYIHIRTIEVNKNIWTKLKYWCKEKAINYFRETAIDLLCE